jgi:hypothetical protein
MFVPDKVIETSQEVQMFRLFGLHVLQFDAGVHNTHCDALLIS